MLTVRAFVLAAGVFALAAAWLAVVLVAGLAVRADARVAAWDFVTLAVPVTGRPAVRVADRDAVAVLAADGRAAIAVGLAVDRDFAAAVSCLAASVIALVAVFIACMAVDMVLADEVALVAATVILVAAVVTFVAAVETVLAAVAAVGTDDAALLTPPAVRDERVLAPVVREVREAVVREVREAVVREVADREADRDALLPAGVARVILVPVLRVFALVLGRLAAVREVVPLADPAWLALAFGDPRRAATPVVL